MTEATEVKSFKTEVFEVIKALLIAIGITLVLILGLALLMKWVDVPEGALLPINQTIKAIALLVAALAAFRSPRAGWRKGLLLGVFYVVVSFVIFSLIDGQFVFHKGLIWDFCLGSAMGLICGILAVNMRR